MNTVQIPFPDFRMADIIEPEEFDANNKALADTVNAAIQVLNQYVLSVEGNTAGNSYYTKREIETLIQFGQEGNLWLDGGSFHDTYIRPANVDGGSFEEVLSDTLVFDGGAF